MLDFLFGEGQYGLRFLFAFIVVLGLIGLFAWLARRFGATKLGSMAARGRQPRLAVIDAAAVDGRRRLLLIRRDNVEHLLMSVPDVAPHYQLVVDRLGAMDEVTDKLGLPRIDHELALFAWRNGTWEKVKSRPIPPALTDPAR